MILSLLFISGAPIFRGLEGLLMTAKRGCATCYISLYIVAGGVYASGEADLFVRVYLDPVAYSGVFSPFFFLNI